MSILRYTKHVIAVVLTLVAIITLWAAGSAVAIFLASLAVAAALHPQVEFFKTRGWPSWAAAGLVAGICALVFFGSIAMLAPSLVTNLQVLENDISTSVSAFVQSSPDHWFARLWQPVSESDVADSSSPVLSNIGSMLLAPLIGTAKGLIELSALSGICLALAFYWTLDRERFERLWLSLVPVRRRVGAQRMWQSIEREVGAYLRSECIQFFLAVMLLWIVFMLLDLRYAALVALLAGSLTLIPWLGTLFAASAVLLLTSPKLVDWSAPWFTWQSGMALVAIILVLCFLEFVVEPKLFQRDRYNPLWIALTAILMAATWGFWGLLFGPLVGFVLQIFVRQVYPRLVQVQPRITSEVTFSDRLRELDERFAQQEEVPRELISLKQRLVDIIEQRDRFAANA